MTPEGNALRSALERVHLSLQRAEALFHVLDLRADLLQLLRQWVLQRIQVCQCQPCPMSNECLLIL
jgi:hypothetical protein